MECYEVLIFGNRDEGTGEGAVMFSNVAPR